LSSLDKVADTPAMNIEDQAPSLPEAGGRIETTDIGNHRVDVWIPDEVSSGTPILVMHDGENIFYPRYTYHKQTWGVLNAIAEDRIVAERMPIVVAVWGLRGEHAFDKSRMYELAPEDLLVSNPDLYQMMDKADFESEKLIGNRYQSLLAEQILPYVAQTYGVELAKNRTAIMGSSMGGLASLYGLAKYPDVYGAALCLSTHVAFWDPAFIPGLIGLLPKPGSHLVWTDRGSINLDSQYEQPHREVISAMLAKGYTRDVDFQAHIFDGTDHNELAWSRRIEYPLNWWLSNC